VTPPRLGGKVKKGVFATRSPFRPNALGLSCVRLEKIEEDPKLCPVLYVAGADLMDNTPIYDIKPYLPYADSHGEARGGITESHSWDELQVDIPVEVEKQLDATDIEVLRRTLALDPRPHYHEDDGREYGMPFRSWDVRFRVIQGKAFVVKLIRKSEF
jgi:hypothetical protein